MSKGVKTENLQNKFTFRELRKIWIPLSKYCKDNYSDILTPNNLLDIKKRWIHFYSSEDFTLDETIQEIEDYTGNSKVELRSIRGH
tara:strand:+ start:1544 stop:1801 length:258 start_codon:yes stop_codon:yes gene_type:complete